MITQCLLETDRLRLHPLTDADAPSIQAAANVRAVADIMLSIPHPYPADQAERSIFRQLAESKAGHSVAFVIEH